MKKSALSLIALSLLLTSCTSNDENINRELVPPSQMPLGPQDMITSETVPEVPSITQEPMTSIGVQDNQELSTLSNEDKEVKDDWYIQQVRASGVDNSKTRLYDIRDTVCNLLEQEASLNNISRSLSEYDFTEEQLGVIIGTSMISSCPEYSAVIKESDLPENNN